MLSVINTLSVLRVLPSMARSKLATIRALRQTSGAPAAGTVLVTLGWGAQQLFEPQPKPAPHSGSAAQRLQAASVTVNGHQALLDVAPLCAVTSYLSATRPFGTNT